jgi:23S rRNA pseudouridine1911/1915/1917 synthase
MDTALETPEALHESTVVDYTDVGFRLAGAEGLGQRVDRFVADALKTSLPGLSRTRVQHWIRLGAVHINARETTAAHRLNAGDTVDVWPQPLEADCALEPDPMELEVVYEDKDLLIVHKSKGVVVHPAPGHWRATLMNGLLHLRASLAELPRAGIVHRLDRDTSGLLIVAKRVASLAVLQEQLSQRRVDRVYLALVHGNTEALQRSTINAPIGRDPLSRVRMACDGLAARDAVTHAVHLRTYPQAGSAGTGAAAVRPVSMMSCKLESGRTHQIRVHLASRGYPLLGDPLYGAPTADAHLLRVQPGWGEILGQGQALHAALLALAHPRTGHPMCFHAAWPLPAEFLQPDRHELCRLWGLAAV